jgi:SAM-dependent methyltransferase
MNAEFDNYAADYKNLLQDPLRDRFAGDSLFFHRRKWILLRDFLRKHGRRTSGGAWLDVGCGKGELLRFGTGEFGRLAGCDFSEGMVSGSSGFEARRQESPQQLPFETGSFDLVTAVCVYHHVEDRLRAPLAAEACRVLKPGGFFCMIEHNPLNPVTRVIVKRCPLDAGAHLLTARNARKLMRSAGMNIVETRYFLFLPEKLFDRASVLENALGHFPLGGQYAVFGRKSGGR